jgi:hypothetical protein
LHHHLHRYVRLYHLHAHLSQVVEEAEEVVEEEDKL